MRKNGSDFVNEAIYDIDINSFETSSARRQYRD